jgi:alkane 1-monooxygenase
VATVWAIGQLEPFDLGAKLLMVVTMGLYAGQVSNACAHELIHRGDRAARNLGCAIYCSVLNGQHVSAHLLVHHVHAGTARDPNSAPIGRGFYRFALAASLREFTDGWRVETARRAGRGKGLHPYVVYLGGAALSLVLAGWLAGYWGIIALCAIAVHAQMQLLLSDYVQHYGLRRSTGPDGKPEPMGPAHSWNAPQPFSTALMLGATLHSDHHMNPQRPFPALALDAGPMPTLPFGLPVMGALALIPPLWRRIMDTRVRRFSDAPPYQGRPRSRPIEPLLSE